MSAENPSAKSESDKATEYFRKLIKRERPGPGETKNVQEGHVLPKDCIEEAEEDCSARESASWLNCSARESASWLHGGLLCKGECLMVAWRTAP